MNQSITNIEDYEIASVAEESNAIERDYHAYFDCTIENDDMNRCFSR